MAHVALREIQYFTNGARTIVRKGTTFDFPEKEARRLLAKGAIRETRPSDAPAESTETE